MGEVYQEECIKDFKYIFDRNLCKGKVAFITGGGSGIGFTIAEMLMRHGCSVAIASRNEARLRGAAQTLERATGGTCFTVQMDVRKPQDIIKAVDATIARFNRIDILVNNAAGNFLCPISGLSFNAYRTVLEIDTMGTFNTSKVVYEKYFQNHGGVIVNITATLPYRGRVLQAHAGSAKAAIDALTKHMAMEWGGDGVRVVGIAPGPIADTEGVRRLAGDQAHQLAPLIPLGRFGKRSDIAGVVVFMTSEGASYITGETVVVDGGAWMCGPNSMAFGMERMNRVANSKM